MIIRTLLKEDQSQVKRLMEGHPLQFPPFIVEQYSSRWQLHLEKQEERNCHYCVAIDSVGLVVGHAGYIRQDAKFNEIVGQTGNMLKNDGDNGTAGQQDTILQNDGSNEIVRYMGEGQLDARFYEIVGVVVSKEQQRSGIGGMLLDHICTKLHRLNVEHVVLYTLGHPGNEGSIAFYKRLGFELIKRENDYYIVGYDRVTFTKKL